jgi:hypothetical protein
VLLDNLEVTHSKLEVFNLNESGDTSMEYAPDDFILVQDDRVIHLNEEYSTNDLKISQGDIEIVLENEEQLNYFKYILKLKREEKQNATKDNQT